MCTMWQQEVSNSTDLHAVMMSNDDSMCKIDEKLKIVLLSSFSKSKGVNACEAVSELGNCDDLEVYVTGLKWTGFCYERMMSHTSVHQSGSNNI